MPQEQQLGVAVLHLAQNLPHPEPFLPGLHRLARLGRQVELQRFVPGLQLVAFPAARGAQRVIAEPHRHSVKPAGQVFVLPRGALPQPPESLDGQVFRLGPVPQQPNNSLTPLADSPGSPWAIGSEAGGHTAIEPALGSLDDFDHFVLAARRLGLEVALDFAIQCSPDHPWVREHPEWFRHRPDGSIKYAENPPKEYQDIYPLDFEAPAAGALMEALKEAVLFWIGHGVRIFRVDNPHTKPVEFWHWLIEEVQQRHPDTIFLAEAFTRPKVMMALAKAGFTQSYTYFTWRNTKTEFIEYLT